MEIEDCFLHPKPKPVKCPYCKKRFSGVPHLKVHLYRRHRKEYFILLEQSIITLLERNKGWGTFTSIRREITVDKANLTKALSSLVDKGILRYLTPKHSRPTKVVYILKRMEKKIKVSYW